MSADLPSIGKISAGFFDQVIYPHLGRRRREVLVGPQNGVDVGVVDLGNDQVMITTTDPVFVVPPYGWERSGWFAIHILASDAVTAGIAPGYLTIDLNLPMSMTRDDLEALWTTMHRECDKIGMAIVSGHTGRYEGCNYPMIGGATVISIGPKSQYVTPRMARPGDHVVVTKGAAIEATGLFAVTFPQRIAAEFGADFARRAEDVFWQMSVVDDAMTAVQVGVRDDGVTSMHDATECGVWGGLVEVAQASKVGMNIDKSAVIVDERVQKICALFDIDPMTSISEGTLLITCRPHKSEELLQRLHDRSIAASIVGEVTDAAAGTHYTENGITRPLVHPHVDPFWAAFGKAAEQATGG
jgi:hydrogenase expression/formation protein HypE